MDPKDKQKYAIILGVVLLIAIGLIVGLRQLTAGTREARKTENVSTRQASRTERLQTRRAFRGRKGRKLAREMYTANAQREQQQQSQGG